MAEPPAGAGQGGAAVERTGQAIHLSLLSHTNVGKTTLARTLLREDIGEVGDRAHVTELAESHVLVETHAGDSLVLWDTPGFGDSVRLLKRLRGTSNPVGWFMSVVWDRFADRPFWCSQQAMRTARESSDLVLYVVNAAEDPAGAGYVEPELEILGWIGRPVLLLLNQLGDFATPTAAEAEVRRWRAHVAGREFVRGVLPFDAFARCWVQEQVLLAELEPLLPDEKRAAFARLRTAWRDRDLEVLRRSMQVLARQVAALAADRETLGAARLGDRARSWLQRARSGREQQDPAVLAAEAALAERLDRSVRESTDELVRLHGLVGGASEEILQRIGREFAVARAVDAREAGVVGGLVSGALGGLAADLAAGGLTLGAGALIGGVLGAFGGRGLARAYNQSQGSETGEVRWSAEFLLGRVGAGLARYLAVAHFGRGRGAFVVDPRRRPWQALVEGAVERRRAAFESAFREAGPAAGASVAARLEPLLAAATLEVLRALYVEAGPHLPAPGDHPGAAGGGAPAR